jgi:transcriptional regulator with XRE-family HTH domain
MARTPSSPWLELRVIRTKDGHTQTSLAREAGLSKSYLCELEAGHRKPNPRVIKLLATALNVPSSVLEPRTLKAAC